ncbi:ROK family protein [Patescibacteria group bacterium]|nr:ROK family protein [Patescibacteria group bacterium]
MYLVFDIGGTNMRIAVSLDSKTIKESKIIPTPTDFTLGIQALKKAADELSGGENIEGVAGGIAIILNKDKTMAVRSTHMKDWINKPLKNELEKTFQAPVFLENDAKIEGLGEANRGAGMGKSIVAYISIGTGIGGARVVDNHLDKNAVGGVEPAHQIIVPDGNSCECGGKGHLEAYVAGTYLERIYHQKGETITDPAIWDEVSKYLAIGLTNVTVHWSPDILVLGGSVSQSLPLERVKNHLKQFLTIYPQPPQLVRGTLGDDAGLYGALELLK